MSEAVAKEGKTVQEYIDETPFWADGTDVPYTPMTRMQWRIWMLATAGKFFEGMVVFMTGVALPLLVNEFGLSASEKGMVGAATLFGILVGATALGGLSDVFGRKRMFIVEMVLFVAFVIGITMAPNVWWVVLFLFGMGAALGCDYPTAHMVISESIPSRDRGKLVLSAFGFQAVGALAGTVVGYMVLAGDPQIGAWRWMYATAIVPAILVVIGRFFIPDSGQWLVSRGRMADAEHETRRLLTRNPQYPHEIKLVAPKKKKKHKKQEKKGNAALQVQETPAVTEMDANEKTKSTYAELFQGKNLRATIFASVPWFLQDLGTYGIGIFTPTILVTVLGVEAEAHNVAGLIHNDIFAAKGAAFLDLLLIFGILFAVLLSDKLGRVRLQVIGFIGCAAGLALAALSSSFSGQAHITLIFAGFMLFNFMTNMGPNAQTYLIAGEVFPTHIRGKGAGFAASFAKIGAVATAFLFPILLKDIGTTTLLIGLVCTSLLGAAITWAFRIETSGVSLEDVGEEMEMAV